MVAGAWLSPGDWEVLNAVFEAIGCDRPWPSDEEFDAWQQQMARGGPTSCE